MYGLRLSYVLIAVLRFTLAEALESSNSPAVSQKAYDYDLIVVGGGSGGLAAAKEAHVKYKKRVLVLDYVSPSPRGTHWGVGGTCVNAGCIPKKLMHQASLIGEAAQEASLYGWEISHPEKIKLNWAKMREAIQNHVKSVNYVTGKQLTHLKVKKVTDYINGLGEFVDANTIKVTLRDENDQESGKLSTKTQMVTAENILIAVGGRPVVPNIEGAKQFAITSDDLFSLEDPPGRTLIIGAGYIGLECAGFLSNMGFDVTVMSRAVVLREFDRQMADLVKEDLKTRGVTFFGNTEVVSIAEESKGFTSALFGMFSWVLGNPVQKNKHLRVKWKKKTETGAVEEGEGYWNTVMLATGRRALTSELKVANANIEVTEDGKIKEEQTNIPNIYAVGDVLHGKPELTPVAIQAGRLLMDRLYGGSTVQMDYQNVATTVFTPQEYSCVGLTEKKAIEEYGEDNIEVYHSKFNPIEYAIPKSGKPRCYLKVICKREGDQLILGMHFFGPSAGEVMQGYAAAMKAGLTFKQLQDTVGIHPTASEEFTRVSVTKRSKIDPAPPSCCS